MSDALSEFSHRCRHARERDGLSPVGVPCEFRVPGTQHLIRRIKLRLSQGLWTSLPWVESSSGEMLEAVDECVASEWAFCSSVSSASRVDLGLTQVWGYGNTKRVPGTQYLS